MVVSAPAPEGRRMFDLAHVTDLHLVEMDHARRTGTEWQRLHYLSAGRRIDAEGRRLKALEAMRVAGRNARHIVLTGDLTEDGVPAQFDLLAEVMEEAGLDPDCVTLVPGNHDRYAEPQNFEKALEGPLRAYATTSSAGETFELGRDAWLMPVSTAIAQSWLRSAGRISDEDVDRIERFATDARAAGKLALVAQHHPPQGYGGTAWNFIDGLLNAAVGKALVRAHAGLTFVHGHTHKRESTVFVEGRAPQTHSGAAVVARSENLRYYQITREALVVVEKPAANTIGSGGAVALA
jgi:3',5'-cyclic AMP phosphodiesterase CpdA